jgi:hypothetical protein
VRHMSAVHANVLTEALTEPLGQMQPPHMTCTLRCYLYNVSTRGGQASGQVHVRRASL